MRSSHLPSPWLPALAAALLIACGTPVSAQSSATTTSADATIAATAPGDATPAAPAQPVSLWDVSNTLRGSAGWRSNATVSSYQSVDRPFYRAELESFLLRPLGSTGRLIAFLSGDVLRYVNAPKDVPGEQQWAADLEGRWEPVSWLRGSLKGVGFLQDVFIDPSETEGAAQPATWVRLVGGYTTLTPRMNLPAGFALEPSFQIKRIDYRRGYAGDYNESRPGVRLEWKRSDRLVLSAAYYEHRRHYAHLPASASGGRLLATRLLGLEQKEGEVKASTRFDAAGQWTLSLLGGRLENRDRAFGFLDYNQKRVELGVGWERGPWRLTATADTRHQDYLHQTVGFGLQHTPRIADDYELTFRVERDLSAKWCVFAENRWERNRSNINDDPQYRFSYRTDTVLAGVQRSF